MAMKGTRRGKPSTTVGKGVRGAKWDQGRTDVRFAPRRQRIGEERRRKHEQQQPRHWLGVERLRAQQGQDQSLAKIGRPARKKPVTTNE
jgi:hypothetical protein